MVDSLGRGSRGAHDPRTLLSEEAAELLGTRPPVGARRLLAAVVVAVGAALAWGTLGRVESTVAARGVLSVEGASPARVSAELRVPGEGASRLALHQRARVRLGSGPSALVAGGEVVQIVGPIADQELGSVTRAVVALDGWPAGVTPVAGLAVEGLVVTGETTPLAWLLGRAP